MTTPANQNGIRERRLRLTVPQGELARHSRVSQGNLCMFEGGYQPQRSKALERVLACLDRLEAEQAAERNGGAT
jgi:predicted transcriptional regulator